MIIHIVKAFLFALALAALGMHFLYKPLPNGSVEFIFMLMLLLGIHTVWHSLNKSEDLSNKV